MHELKRMAVWTIRQRVRSLRTFGDLLAHYYASLEYDDLGVHRHPDCRGEAIRSSINMQLASVRVALAAVGCDGEVTISDPPAIGGRQNTFELFANLFSEAVCDHPRTPIDLVETAIGIYQAEVAAAWMRTLNPLHWLNEILLYIITIPLRFLASLGVPRVLTESSAIARLYVGVFHVASWTVIAFSILQAFGYWKAARTWLERLLH